MPAARTAPRAATPTADARARGRGPARGRDPLGQQPLSRPDFQAARGAAPARTGAARTADAAAQARQGRAARRAREHGAGAGVGRAVGASCCSGSTACRTASRPGCRDARDSAWPTCCAWPAATAAAQGDWGADLLASRPTKTLDDAGRRARPRRRTPGRDAAGALRAAARAGGAGRCRWCPSWSSSSARAFSNAGRKPWAWPAARCPKRRRIAP